MESCNKQSIHSNISNVLYQSCVGSWEGQLSSPSCIATHKRIATIPVQYACVLFSTQCPSLSQFHLSGFVTCNSFLLGIKFTVKIYQKAQFKQTSIRKRIDLLILRRSDGIVRLQLWFDQDCNSVFQ